MDTRLFYFNNSNLVRRFHFKNQIHSNANFFINNLKDLLLYFFEVNFSYLLPSHLNESIDNDFLNPKEALSNYLSIYVWLFEGYEAK